MKYALLTPIKDLITSELSEEILEISKYPERLTQTTHWSNSYFKNSECEKISDKNANPVIQEKYKHTYGDNGKGSGYFIIAHAPPDLEKRLFARLPESILRMDKLPYLRIQILKNYSIIPHIDFRRNVGLITPITENPSIRTIFYDVTKPHEYYREHFPDPDLIVEKCSIRFGKGETWLIDTDSVHSTGGLDDNFRVTVNFMWSQKDMLDLIPLMFAR